MQSKQQSAARSMHGLRVPPLGRGHEGAWEMRPRRTAGTWRQGGGSHQQALNKGEDGPRLFWVLERLAGWQWGNRLAGPGLTAERPEESRAVVPTKEKWARE